MEFELLPLFGRQRIEIPDYKIGPSPRTVEAGRATVRRDHDVAARRERREPRVAAAWIAIEHYECAHPRMLGRAAAVPRGLGSLCDHTARGERLARPDRIAPVTIVAHRGVLDRAPGNTLAAFRDALALGVDGVELDVRMSRDGVPIVHHDWYLDESVARPVPIYTLSAAQLRTETVRDDRPQFSRQHSIPTLADVLEEFAGTLSLEIELKSPEPELPAAVGSVLEPFRDAWPTFEITSSSTSLLADVRECCPHVRTALLFGPSAPYMRLDVVAYAAVQSGRLAKADVVHLYPDQLSEEVMATIRAAGIEVHVYPVNDEKIFELVARHAVPEVITDDPARVLALRRSQRG